MTHSNSAEKTTEVNYEISDKSLTAGMILGAIAAVAAWAIFFFYSGITTFSSFYRVSLLVFISSLPLMFIYLWIRHTKCVRQVALRDSRYYEYVFREPQPTAIQRAFRYSRTAFVFCTAFSIVFVSLGLFSIK